MKKTIITLCMVLTATCGWAQNVWNNVSSYCDNDRLSLTATEVEFKQDETIIHLHVQNGPNYGVGYPGMVLKDENGKKYAIKSGEPTRSYETKCNIVTYDRAPQNGIMNYSLHFEPVTDPTKRLHAYTGYGYYDFKIWNIHQVKDMDISLFNSNWRNENGDWVLGLYDTGAVYNSKVYSYAEKSDKKVVLTNGDEKLTIAIGKEKNGKRQFTINNQKMNLECFDAVLPAYPTEDNTPFSTEYTNGECVITGWVKDFPKEIPEPGEKFGVSIKVNDIVTGDVKDFNEATIDENGKFTIKVKVNGTQSVIFNEYCNNVNVYEARMILQPGKNYFMVHNWETNKCMFMGDDARLQNELQAFPCKYEWKTSVFMADKVKSFDSTMVRINDLITKYPTLSKRYREYIEQEARLRAAANLILSMETEEAMQASDKVIVINPSLPVSLCPTLPEYVETKYQYTLSSAYKKYRQTPELYFRFADEGKIQLSDSDRDILKRWQQRNEAMEKLNDCKTEEEAKAVYEEIEKIVSSDELRGLIYREDINRVYTEWAPNTRMLERTLMDSIYSDQQMRDYWRTQIIVKSLTRLKSLPPSAETDIQAIKGEVFKQKISDLVNYYKELAKQNEEKVKKVIAPSSNVAGLTDGKAIVEKMVEPYKGKIVYMDLWGTWCEPCIQSIKRSPEIKEAVKDYDIVYLYFAYSSEDAAWKGCIAELGLTKPNYVHYNLPQEQQEAVIKYLKIDGFPSYFIFDKNGNMEPLDRGHIGDVEGFKKKIEELSKK